MYDRTKASERTAMLLGKEAVLKLAGKKVAIFGLGGVGGHCAEALARSGVGSLLLVDNDTVSMSNLNRQLFATVDDIGSPKTEAAKKRILSVAPECSVSVSSTFVLPENIGTFDFSGFDYVVDAVDTVSAKLAIIKACDQSSTPVISAMGAGNKLDPTKFEVCDIYKTSVCPLAAVIRRECRKAGVKKLKVVYSREPAVTPEFEDSDNSGRRNSPASCAFVPSVSGLIIAGEVIRDLVSDELAKSLSEREKNNG